MRTALLVWPQHLRNGSKDYVFLCPPMAIGHSTYDHGISAMVAHSKPGYEHYNRYNVKKYTRSCCDKSC